MCNSVMKIMQLRIGLIRIKTIYAQKEDSFVNIIREQFEKSMTALVN